MRIFREGKIIKFQLKDMLQGKMLIDFGIHESDYEKLRQHMIKSLEDSPIEKLG